MQYFFGNFPVLKDKLRLKCDGVGVRLAFPKGKFIHADRKLRLLKP